MKLDARPAGCIAVERFRLRFQQRLTDYLLRNGSVAKGFGVMWEKTLEETPMDDDAQGDLYRELITWAKSDEVFASSRAIHHNPLTTTSTNRGELLRAMRRSRLVEIVLARADRPILEARHGRVWDTRELAQDFEVLWFTAPFVIVCHKSDGALGRIEVQADPRFYFNFEPDPQGQVTKAASWPNGVELTHEAWQGETHRRPFGLTWDLSSAVLAVA
jgi:hypothetical protein